MNVFWILVRIVVAAMFTWNIVHMDTSAAAAISPVIFFVFAPLLFVLSWRHLFRIMEARYSKNPSSDEWIRSLWTTSVFSMPQWFSLCGIAFASSGSIALIVSFTQGSLNGVAALVFAFGIGCLTSIIHFRYKSQNSSKVSESN